MGDRAEVVEESPRRILVVGITGSGKTTVAREISNRLGLPHVELDELFWGPSWIANPEDQFRQAVQSALSGGSWVACGNYHGKLHDLTWRQADLIVWLDLPKIATLRRLITRTWRRVSRGQTLWHGNKETLRNVFFSRESLLVWWWKVQRQEPDRTLERLRMSPQARVVRLRSKRDIGEWLETLNPPVGTGEIVGQRWPARVSKEIEQFITTIVGKIKDELGDQLVGIYLHGSLAHGSYYQPKSDVDLLVVVTAVLQQERRQRLAELFADLSNDRPTIGDIEVSVVTRECAGSFEHPMPFEVHYSSEWKEAIRGGKVDFSKSNRDPDLAAHVTSLLEGGVALMGPLPSKVFGPVPDDVFRDSLMQDFNWIVDERNILTSPFYGVLNGCRILMVLQGATPKKVPTKEEAAIWALNYLPVEHHAVIRRALEAYRSAAPVVDESRSTAGWEWDEEKLLALRDYLNLHGQ